MTLTASPTTHDAVDQAAFADIADASRENWFTTADHRSIARLHLSAILLALTGTLVVGLLVGLEYADAGKSVFKADVDRFFNFERFLGAYSVFLPALVLGPLWVALGTLVVPRQLGSARLAFPRVQSLVLWTYVVGAGFLVASFIVRDGPPQAYWYLQGGLPESALNPGKGATDLLVASLMLLTVSALLAAANFIATVVTQRRPGTRIESLRPFTLATLVTSGLVVLTAPVTLAGLLFTYIDLHFGGGSFASGGGSEIASHTLWLLGRPEVFLFTLPALGAVGDIVSSRARARLLGGPAHAYLLVLFGALTLTAYIGREYGFATVTAPFTRWWTCLVLIPMALLGLVWLGTLALNGVKPSATLIFVLGFLALPVLGGVMAIAAAATEISNDSAWRQGFLLSAVFGVPLVAGLGAVCEWASAAWGRKLNQGLVALAGLSVVGGLALAGIGPYLAGLDGAPFGPGDSDQWDAAHLFGVLGMAGVLAGVGLIVINLLLSVAARNGAIADDELDLAITGGAS